MKKPFLTIEEKINYIENVKGIKIQDKANAIEMLRTENYLNIIYPYKFYFAERSSESGNKLLKIAGKHQYKSGTTFEDFVEKYKIDEELRIRYASKVVIYEKRIKSVF